MPHRLIVLIPAGSDYTAETQRIWKLADTTCRRVLLLSLCNTTAEELRLRRQLAAMSALIGNVRVSTETKIEIGTSWLDAVRASYRTGDRIVCFSEHRAGLLHRPVHQILEANLGATVYILWEHHPQKTRPDWFSQSVVWLGLIAIISSFGILQARIAQLPKDWFQNVLFILSILIEFWLIWVWNSLND